MPYLRSHSIPRSGKDIMLNSESFRIVHFLFLFLIDLEFLLMCDEMCCILISHGKPNIPKPSIE